MLVSATGLPTHVGVVCGLLLSSIQSIFPAQVSKQLNVFPHVLKHRMCRRINEHTAPQIIQNRKLLTEAVSLFYATRGFDDVLDSACDMAHIPPGKGFLWEIERALYLQCAGTTIDAFGGKLPTTEPHREHVFDLITRHSWIECKNIVWPKTPYGSQRAHKLIQQLSYQSELINKHNRLAQQHITHEINSKQSMPQAWKRWCAQHDIQVYEHASRDASC